VLGNPAATAEEQSLAARLMGEAGRIAAMGGRARQGLGWAMDAVTLAQASGDPAAMLHAYSGMAVSSVFTGGTDLTRWFEEGVALAANTGTWWMLAMAAGFFGATVARNDLAAGEALVVQAEDAARRSGSPYIIGAVGDAHGRLLSATGRTDEAVERYRMAIARFAEVGDERMTLAVRSDLAHALRRGDRAAEAMAAYRETIGGWVHFGHRGAVANQLENIAYLAVEAGALETAARLLGAAEAMREAFASPRAADEEPEQDAYVARARAGLEPAAFGAAWAAGRSLKLSEAVALAVA